MSKFYAVRVGRNTGIFTTWPETSKNVTGYSGAIFKSFTNRKDAENFLVGDSSTMNQQQVIISSSPVPQQFELTVYTDGSFNTLKGGFSCITLKQGVLIEKIYGRVPDLEITNNVNISVIKHTNDEVLIDVKFSDSKAIIATNNRAELFGIWTAINRHPKVDLLIRTDSQYSIGCLTNWYITWEKNGWKTSKREDVENQDMIKSILSNLRERNFNVRFEKVEAHSGDTYNELADKYAKLGTQI